MRKGGTLNNQLQKKVHSNEELLTSLFLEIRRLVARSQYRQNAGEPARRMLSLAESALSYLINMMEETECSCIDIGTRPFELNVLRRAVHEVRLMSAQELLKHVLAEDLG